MLAALNRLGKESRPLLNGERYLTDKEVGARLKVSRRTLQNYRNAGRIPYILLAASCSTVSRTLRGCSWRATVLRLSGCDGQQS